MHSLSAYLRTVAVMLIGAELNSRKLGSTAKLTALATPTSRPSSAAAPDQDISQDQFPLISSCVHRCCGSGTGVSGNDCWLSMCKPLPGAPPPGIPIVVETVFECDGLYVPQGNGPAPFALACATMAGGTDCTRTGVPPSGSVKVAVVVLSPETQSSTVSDAPKSIGCRLLTVCINATVQGVRSFHERFASNV